MSNRSYFLKREEMRHGDCVVRHGDAELGPGWLWFQSPARILEAGNLDQVLPAVREAEEAARHGSHCVGFLSYEAASAFDPSLPEPRNRELPLAWFAVFEAPPRFARELLPEYDGEEAIEIDPEWTPSRYHGAYSAVKDGLKNGEAYQINLTFRSKAHHDGSLFRLFRRMNGVEPAPYAAYLNGGTWEIASLSPERFFQRQGETVRMSPMKGTRRGQNDTLPDMTTDPKSLAENLMIVDMVRNDLGKVAKIGSVQTPNLFQVESHRTVRQMTSTVEARTHASLADLLRAIFPPASVTGAPKVAACRFIADLESSPREVYCGAIGRIEPGGDARFSVAIRTAWRAGDGPIRYGIGSGIVWDSDADQEYEECLMKAEVLKRAAPQWELVECFHRDALCDRDLLRLHWDRLSRSALALDIPFQRQDFENAIAPLCVREGRLPPKIRMAVRQDGTMSVSASESAIDKPRLAAGVAWAIASGHLGMRHKTNSRQVFQQALDVNPTKDEVLLFNERGEAAEFCRGNAVFVLQGNWITPSPECGCLPGIGALRLVKAHKAEYGTVTLAQAQRAEAIYFVNSIRGLVPVDVDWIGPADHRAADWCCDRDTTER